MSVSNNPTVVVPAIDNGLRFPLANFDVVRSDDEVNHVEVLITQLRYTQPILPKTRSVQECAGIAAQIFIDFQLFNHEDPNGKKLLYKYCREVIETYPNNPYHRKEHPIDILQFAVIAIVKTEIYQFLNDKDLFTLFTAILSHDIEHPGFSLSFFVALEQDPESKGDFYVKHPNTFAQGLESGNTPFEWKHAKRGWGILIKHSLNGCVIDERAFATIIGYTEMGKTNEFIQRISNTTTDPDMKILLLSWVVMAADVSNVSRAKKAADAWSKAVNEEFDAEIAARRKYNFPLGAFLDSIRVMKNPRRTESFAKGHPRRIFSLMRDEGSFAEIIVVLDANIVAWSNE